MVNFEPLTPPEVVAVFLSMGEKKHRQPYYTTFFKAWMAGFILSFGAMLYQVIINGSSGLKASNPALEGLIAAAVFPVGLIMLVLTGQELITANFMILPMSTLKGRTPFWGLLANWTVVFFGNLAGALFYVAFMAHWSGLYSAADLQEYSRGVSVVKTSIGFGPCVIRGIGCNFLVCIAIWLGLSARDSISKIVGLWIPIFAFVMLRFEHVVANMFYVPMGLLNGAEVSVGRYITQSMIPSFLGNIIGGLLVGSAVFVYDPPAFFRRSGEKDLRSEVVTLSEFGGDGLPSPSGDRSPRATSTDKGP